MTVDHKAIREYVDKGVYSILFFNRFASEEQIFSVHANDEDEALELFWLSHPKNKFLLDDDDCSVYEANKQEREWLRQLLDENQALEFALSVRTGAMKCAVDDVVSLQDTIEAQAKEIERLKIERDNLKASIEGCKGIEEYYRIQSRLWECQADKAAAVEALRKILCVTADGSVPDEWNGSTGGSGHAECRKIARTTLQRIESGESK